ncbi:MAG: hypothetical protein QXF28_00750 [Nitrososphaerota archaeon]
MNGWSPPVATEWRPEKEVELRSDTGPPQNSSREANSPGIDSG